MISISASWLLPFLAFLGCIIWFILTIKFFRLRKTHPKLGNLKILALIGFILGFVLFLLYWCIWDAPSVIPLLDTSTQLTVLSLLLTAMAFLTAHYASDLDAYREKILKKKINGRTLRPVHYLPYPRVTIIFSFCITIMLAILYSLATLLMGQNVTQNIVKIIVMNFLLVVIVIIDFGLDLLQYLWSRSR